MKKLLIVFVAMIALLLVACKPTAMTKETYDLGSQGYKIVELKMNGKISADEAISGITEIMSSLEELEFKTSTSQSYAQAVYDNLNGAIIDITNGYSLSGTEYRLRKLLGKGR